jgi:hypothetical protein
MTETRDLPDVAALAAIWPGRRSEVPLAPGCNDLDVGSERVIAELKAHLVVALAGGPVSDGIGPHLARSGVWLTAGSTVRVP